jgi:hypothetical protein
MSDTQPNEVVDVTQLGCRHAATRREVNDRSAPSDPRGRRLFPNAKHENVLFPRCAHAAI